MKTEKLILDLIDEFVANHNASTLSVSKYKQNLKMMVEWLTKNADVRTPQRSDIIRFREWMIQSGRKAHTIDAILASVRQFFKYLEEHDYYDNIAAGISSPKKSKKFKKDHLRPDQVHTLLASINKSTITGKRDYAIMNLMVRTGMRCIEVSRMNVCDMIIDEGSWIIDIQGKGRIDKDRTLGVTEKVIEPIREYLNMREVTEDMPMFINHSYVSHDTRITTLTMSKIIKKRLVSIGLNNAKLTAHSLRHTAAVNTLLAGATIFQVQQMLGHSDIKTTQVYLLSIAEEQAREGGPVRLLDDIY